MSRRRGVIGMSAEGRTLLELGMIGTPERPPVVRGRCPVARGRAWSREDWVGWVYSVKDGYATVEIWPAWGAKVLKQLPDGATTSLSPDRSAGLRAGDAVKIWTWRCGKRRRQRTLVHVQRLEEQDG